jgi:histidine phosphotransferase ChpT
MNINAHIGSRIFLDLISPLSANSNRIELLQLAGRASGPEIELLTDSVENATSRLKFMRLMFGSATHDQTVARSDLLTTLQAMARGGRLSYSWNVAGDASHMEVRTALLAVMCIETALPFGGDIEITLNQTGWSV